MSKIVSLSRIFTKYNLLCIVAAFLAIHMLSVPFVIKPILVDNGPTWLGLDVSWDMALNYGIAKHLVFGRDIITTYGPLGYLSTRYGYGLSPWVFFAFDIFIVINFFMVFKDFLLNAANKIIAILILFCTTLLANTFFGPDLTWVIMFFIFYWFYKSFHDAKYVYFIFACLLTVLSFYIKLNVGLLSVVFLVGHLLNLCFYRKIKISKAFVVLLILSGMFGLSFFLLNVSFAAYVKNSIEIVKGFNDVMYLHEVHKKLVFEAYTIFYLMLVLYLVHAAFLIKKKNYSQLYFSVLSIAYIFLLKKQSLFRNDIQHIQAIFNYAPLLLLYGNLYSINTKAQKIISAATLFVIVLSLIFINPDRPVSRAFCSRFTILNGYRKAIWEYDTPPYFNQPEKRYIPQRILDKVNNSTIDIFPWDTEYLLENKLNYTPRPLYQSDFAYTQTLEKINYDFYVDKAPEYVIYDYDAIDERYPFSDESLVNLFLVKNYTFADSFTSNERWRILLQKKEKTSPLVFDKLKEQDINIGDEIPVNGFAFMTINVEYNFAGKLKCLWGKPPTIRIMFMKPDGTWLSYRTSRELLKAGVMVYKLVTNNKDFSDFITQQSNLQSIKKVKFFTDPGYYSSKVKVRYFDIK